MIDYKQILKNKLTIEPIGNGPDNGMKTIDGETFKKVSFFDDTFVVSSSGYIYGKNKMGWWEVYRKKDDSQFMKFIYSSCFCENKINDFINIFLSSSRCRKSYLYLISVDGFVKIGISKYPKDRTAAICGSMPFHKAFVRCYKVSAMNEVESYLHEIYEKVRANGEWFRIGEEEIPKIETYISNNFNGSFDFSKEYKGRHAWTHS